jgi:Flp pilus assembly protein TadG
MTRDCSSSSAVLVREDKAAAIRPRRRGLARLFRQESGQAVVEFAIVVPLIAALVLVLVDFGKAMNYWLDLTQVANEGARLAAVDRLESAGELTLRLKTSELQSGGTDSMPAPATPQVCVIGSGEVGDPVKVEITSDYHWVSFPSWIPIGGGGVLTIKGSATMRLEQPTSKWSPCS